MKSILLLICLISVAISANIPPIANMLFPEAASSMNYPVETHKITTEDGYINTYFRIQAKETTIKEGLPPVYLQHGLLDSGDDWIINDENLAPGLLLANSGYDIWIGNSRGNRYSRGHINNTSQDPNSTYWDFSWQEMSQFDLPAAFEYISNVTKKEKIDYVGHSQGTLIMFAALSRRDPIVVKYIGQFHACGPIAYTVNVSTPTTKKSGKWLDIMELVNLKMFGFMPESAHKAAELVCHYDVSECERVVRENADSNTTVDNVKRFDVLTGHIPAGTSVQNMNYWNQMLKNYEFLMYNYGEKGNMEHYGQKTPPKYDLGKIKEKVYLYAGVYDEAADPTDVERLNSELTGSEQVVYKTYEYGHITFMWGLDTVFFDDLLKNLQEGDSNVIEEKFLEI